MCLVGRTTEKEPRKEALLSVWTGRAAEKDWPKRPSDCQLQEARKKTLIGPSPQKAMAAHSSTLAWKIPWTEEPGRLQSMGSLRVRQDWATSRSLFTFLHWRRQCVSMRARCTLPWCLTLWDPVDCGLPGFSVKEECSPGKDIGVGCHFLLERYISCCPSCQLPWVPGAARSSVTQVPASHLALQGQI